MSLDTIVNVTITTASASVAQRGFGISLIAGHHTEFADLVRTYDASTGLTDMASDGFTSIHPIYKAVQALLSQNPKVKQFKVGKLSEVDKQSIKIVPVAVNSAEYLITIGGEDFAVTSDASATVAEICALLTTEINTGTGAFTAVDSTTHVTVTADNNDECFVYKSYNHKRLVLTDVTGTNTALVADLDLIEAEDADWYGLILANQPEADVEAAAGWAETKIKFFMADSLDNGIISNATTDLGSDLQDSSYARTSLWFHKSHSEYLGAAMMGKIFPFDPGSYTAAYKQLAGVTVDDLKAADIAYLADKNVNYFVTLAGSNRTFFGKSSSGEFIDVTIFVDWLRSRLQERIYSLFINNNKIPFTDLGIALVVAEIRAQLQEGINVGGLAADPEPTVSAPLAADVSSVDKANRFLPDVTFTATLAGAIHTLEIAGTLSV